MLRLAKVFSDGMVLQQKKEIQIWGESEPNKSITVEIQGQTENCVADEFGTFHLTVAPLQASVQEKLRVTDGEMEIICQDVSVGEVFLAGGQSNMEFPLRYEKFSKEALKTRDDQLRFFDMPKKYYEEQDTDFDYHAVGRWRKAISEEDLGYFSAIGFYFAQEIREKLQVPVGIIGCNWGGTRSCAWMSEDTVKKVGFPWEEEWQKAIAGRDMAAFWASQKNDPQADNGNPCMSIFDQIVLPGTPSLEEIGKAMMDMSQQMMENITDPITETQRQEFGSNDDGMSQQERMSKMMEAYRKEYLDAKIKPGILYENMVKKIAPFSIRGVLWYQGESEDVPGLQSLYTSMLKGLITDWRSLWQDDELPFIQVQLPGWESWMMQCNLDYATIRKCQEEVTKEMPGVYMASISDVGEQKDIHPKDKKTVGHRMALLARHYLYGEDILCEAPRPKFVKRQKNVITITMENVGKGLQILGDRLEGMDLLQGEREISFESSVEGDQLILAMEESEETSIRIRFARKAWYQVNLVNEAGIPAIPFELRCPAIRR